MLVQMNMTPLLATFALILHCAVSCAGNADAPPKRKPNFLVIVSDDQRPDTIAALGNPVIHTPNLDRLVRRGTNFTRAICPFPLCVPSRAEILTSVTAFGNGVPYGGGKLKKDSVFWASTFHDAGYHTWYCGKWMNDGNPKTRGYEETSGLFGAGGAGPEGREPRYGRKNRLITGYRGWTFKKDDGTPELEKGIGLVGETSRYIADGAIELLDRKPTKPFFLHVNFTAPHDPLVIPPGYQGRYDPANVPLPKNFRGEHPFDHGNFSGRDEQLLPWPRTQHDVRDEIAAYYAVIDDMDSQIGRILTKLQAIGQDENTIVIFTSDHGLALGSHGLMGKQNMYEHTVGVPFIISGPGVPESKHSSAQIYLRDMFPTTCELAGIEIPATVEGKSLVPILQGTAQRVREAAFGYFADSQRMIRTDRWKLIHYPKLGRLQLFDLVNDPDELRDLAHDDSQQSRIRGLAVKMNQWFKIHGDVAPPVKLSD